MKDFKKSVISRNANCIDALRKLDNEESNQILFVIDDDERMIGTLTDGDIRRGLLKGLTLESLVINFCYKNFSYIDGDVDVPTIRRFKKEGKLVFPKLNDKGQIVKVYNLSELKSLLPLQALIMAGGRGERLRPLTDNTPKPMLPLGNKPIIEHNIDLLISYGIERITISVRYLSEQIRNYLGDGSSKGIRIDYIEEDIPLGTLGSLGLLENIEKDILVFNSDVFTNIDLEEFYLTFINSNADMVVASIPYSVDIPYAIMDLNDDCIINFKEKPTKTYYANAGIYLISKNQVDLVPKKSFYNATDLMSTIIQKKGKLIHSPITGYWIDIGKHDDYNRAKDILKHL